MYASLMRQSLLALITLSFLLPQAHAGLVTPSEMLEMERDPAAEVQAYLQREDVAAELAALGVDPELAAERVAALSAEELQTLSERINEMPAGAGLLEVFGIAFIVILLLDLLDVINVFPW